ncbi:MAG: RNA polymerase sigma factor [Lacunisphaera sp.]|nr:RNA polymerase sigma factor [Lacunisphaera sp.]
MKPDIPITPVTDQHSSWFNKEVQPHASSLRAYLRRSFPSVHDVDDVVQESFLRIWKRRLAEPILSSKAFLFKVARNLALDLVRRGQVSPINPVRDLSAVNVVEDKRDAADLADVNEKMLALADAVADLPTRCREIIILRKFKGLSQKEVAAHFAISERTVEVQVARGVKRCEAYLRKRGINSLYGHEK